MSSASEWAQSHPIHGPQDHTAAAGYEPKVLRTPALRALEIGGAERLPTKFETLDTNTRGGPRVGKRIVIGGAPGAGKTTWLTQLLWNYAREGHLALLVAFDEEAEDILIRIGQVHGLSRDDLERGDAEARRQLSEILTDTPTFQLIDADEDGWTIEEASTALAQLRQPGQLSVLGIDSIQTARVFGDSEAKSDKARVDLVMGVLKRAGKVQKHLVMATCELSRGGYRSQNAAERVDDLAAFKESGGIEYGATMALVLRSVKDSEGMVDVTVPKNRMGKREPFRLQLDYRSATFTETEAPTASDEEAIATPMQQVKDKIMKVIIKAIEPITSASELARRAKVSKKTGLRAVKELEEDGRLEKRKGKFVVILDTTIEPDSSTALANVLD